MKPLVISLLLLMIRLRRSRSGNRLPRLSGSSYHARQRVMCQHRTQIKPATAICKSPPEAQPQVTAFSFQQLGDTASVSDIHRLDLAGLTPQNSPGAYPDAPASQSAGHAARSECGPCCCLATWVPHRR
ncbi:MAG: hypothetical protein U0694_20600 [Anaerolineae bacterium]